jgi:hypothetical protein
MTHGNRWWHDCPASGICSKALPVQKQLPGRFGKTAFRRLLISCGTAVNANTENAASFLLIDDNALTQDTISATMVSLVCTNYK